jgi:demethylmenaquinone methyltransferase/2-methoxy-6-polyprenyl-1,4-benzoquinol methylase
MRSTPEFASGTTPPGTDGEQQASRWVERMFTRIAPRYDLLNHLLSFNIDRSWRKILLKKTAPVLVDPNACVLDLCCGTGDVLLDFQEVAKARIYGADFCHPMLTTTQRKAQAKGFHALLAEADALALPMAEDSFDLIAISFGFRNLTNYRAGLAELHRVLKPGGQLAILEFSHPSHLLVKAGYGLYSNVVLPLVGAIISGSREAYDYLPDSIRKFPRAQQLRELMQEAGFGQTEFQLLTGGIAALHIGTKVKTQTAC